MSKSLRERLMGKSATALPEPAAAVAYPHAVGDNATYAVARADTNDGASGIGNGSAGPPSGGTVYSRAIGSVHESRWLRK